MSASYWVLISDELLAAGINWPDGLQFAGDPPAVLPPDVVTAPHELPGAHWHRVQDDAADPGLEDCRVDLTLRIEDGRAVIAKRRVLP